MASHDRRAVGVTEKNKKSVKKSVHLRAGGPSQQSPNSSPFFLLCSENCN